MKSKIAICAFSLSAAILSLSLGGCSNDQSSFQSSTQLYSETNENNSTPIGNSESSSTQSNEKSTVDSTPSIPSGEPTFLIGLDGKPVLTSEITRLENTDKTAETLTKDDLWAEVYCDGFAYYREPSGVGFDNYNNPELFDGYEFLGEIPENKNEWKRVNVGDEIFGLKVKSAVSHFVVNDFGYKFPECYFETNGTQIELEGTIEAEGFLQVNNRNAMYPETNELVAFYPASSPDLPLTASSSYCDNEKGFEDTFDVRSVYNHFADFLYAGEFDEIRFGVLSDISCDTDGVGVGDIAYVRVTLGNITVGEGVEATLEKVERLSDILAHDEDDMEAHQPAPVL